MTKKEKLKILNRNLNDPKYASLDNKVSLTYKNPNDPNSAGRIRILAPVKAEDKDEIAMIKDKDNRDLYLFVQTDGYSKKGILKRKNATAEQKAYQNTRALDLDLISAPKEIK